MPLRRRRHAGAAAVLALLLAGCATEPPQTTRTTNPPSAPSVERPSPEPVQPSDTPAETSVARQDYQPQSWRDPSEDLWAQVRDELSLDPHAQRREVREWTQE